MSYRLMFTINAVALALVGVLFIIMPEPVLTQFKSEVYVATLFMARLMGGALLMGGLFLWFLKETPAKTQKNVAFLLLAHSIGGFVMSILGITTFGVLRANGWLLLVVFGLFSLVYGYMLFLQPKPSASKARSPRKVKDYPPEPNGNPSNFN